MPRATQILTVSSLQGLEDLPTVMAYGDLDDHLRLTVLLSAQLGPELDPNLVAVCQGRATPWPKRKKALQSLLREASSRARGPFVRLVDPDALDIGEVSLETRWDDSAFQSERVDFFNLLLDSFSEGGWQLVRHEPRPWTTSRLDKLGDTPLESQSLPLASATVDRRRLEQALQAVSVALRPLIRALVDTSRLHAREAARMLEASSALQVDELVLEMAYDALSPESIETAKRLALLRGPQHWNGVAGPYALRDDGSSQGEVWPEWLPRAAARELAENRWLDVSRDADGQQRFVMANVLRRFLLSRADITHPGHLLEQRRWLASRNPADVGESVEIHHHAVECLDPALARTTARYYGADLRRIAFELSKYQERYQEAADIYRLIVTEFDAEDAYAWEYLGFNLAKEHEGKELSPDIREEIRQAYVRASKLDPDNPLYKGRELGFRARLKERVNPDFKRYLRRFRQMGDTALSFYSRPVLEPLQLHEREALLDESQADELRSLPGLRGLF